MIPLRRLPLLIWGLEVGVGKAAPSVGFNLAAKGEVCPRCDVLFSVIETSSSGERVQSVETQERGEPKSGTTFMYVWAHGALVKTCDFLNEWFGSESCSVQKAYNDEGVALEKANRLSFVPHLGAADAKCPCPEVDRVEILISFKNKHRLPVNSECRYNHVGTIAVKGGGCLSVDGRRVEDANDIERCMEEADCIIEDDRSQFVIMRDPRAQAVSTFYHEIVHEHKETNFHWIGYGLSTVDEFVMETLPTLCQWLTIRYLLFAGAMAEQSTLFWYTDTLANPTSWHSDWLNSVGVHLPAPVVEEMASAATNGEFRFTTQGKNEHPGEVSAEPETNDDEEEEILPTWKTEISPELMGRIDDIMRQWLPPPLFSRIKGEQ